MLRKLRICLNIFIMLAAITTVIATVIYTSIYGFSGDGDTEAGLILGSWLAFIWCGLNLPALMNPDEDATSSLLEWFWPFS